MAARHGRLVGLGRGSDLEKGRPGPPEAVVATLRKSGGGLGENDFKSLFRGIPGESVLKLFFNRFFAKMKIGFGGAEAATLPRGPLGNACLRKTEAPLCNFC